MAQEKFKAKHQQGQQEELDFRERREKLASRYGFLAICSRRIGHWMPGLSEPHVFPLRDKEEYAYWWEGIVGDQIITDDPASILSNGWIATVPTDECK